MKKSVDFAFDEHGGADGDHPRVSWAVAITDDCEDCEDLRVEVTFEEDGRPGTGLVAHLSPGSARRLQSALGTALRELGAG
ncbi:MAG: hypothetical protein AB1673_16415 [Actinomycetota bacterium]